MGKYEIFYVSRNVIFFEILFTRKYVSRIAHVICFIIDVIEVIYYLINITDIL